MAGFLSCQPLFSCSDGVLSDCETNADAREISFGVAPTNKYGSRVVAETDCDTDGTTGCYVLRADAAADTLCLRAEVSDGINSGSFIAKTAETRAAPITTDGFYDRFHVLAYWKKDGNAASTFYMDDDVTAQSSGVWSAENGVHLWPGEGNTLQFRAFAPVDAGLSAPDTPENTLLKYTVPASAAEQRDVVVATTAELNGGYNAPVPLTFKHICAAVRFVAGSDIQVGTILGITIKGVKDSGTYDMEAEEWTLGSSTADVSLSLNKVTTADTAEGDDLTGTDNTLMMLPQALDDGAVVEVRFMPEGATRERVLTASVAGAEWPMGKTVTYRLSITPEYGLEFVSEPAVQDAHYAICKTLIRTTGIPDGTSWTLEATGVDGVSVQLAGDVNDFAKQGFWTDRIISNGTLTDESARGSSILTSTGNVTDTVYVFIPENTGTEDRTVTLTLNVSGGDSSTAAVQNITQRCPAWTSDGAFGWEQTDDDTAGEYGFSWNRLVSYQYVYSTTMFGSTTYQSYCEQVVDENKTWTSAGFASVRLFRYTLAAYRYCITLDYSQLNLTAATSETDGLENTRTLYEQSGTAATSAFETVLANIMKTESGKESEPAFRMMTESDLYSGSVDTYGPKGENVISSNALSQILKKNKYNLAKTVTQQGSTVYTSYAPAIEKDDIVWFLPAEGQFGNLPDAALYPNCDAVDTDCWSSTAVGNSTHAMLGSGVEEERMNAHKVRACRIKP